MIFSHVLYQLSYLAFPLVAVFCARRSAFRRKRSITRSFSRARSLKVEDGESCLRTLKASRFLTAPAGESSITRSSDGRLLRPWSPSFAASRANRLFRE